MFDPVDPKQSFPDLERGILQYWKEEDTFKRSIRQRSARSGDVLDGPGAKANEESFSFYDGPPFATGLPHYGHLLAGTIKDVIPRYQTMRGKKVIRRFGWDCHGLPIENLIEKEHSITSKKQIEDMGVKAFNALCRGAVQRYTAEWRSVVERMGRWVDMDWDYRTMDADYMESIWWVFSQLAKKELITEGHKPMHVCPHCVTPLSNFEVTQGYKDVTDISATAMFRVQDTEASSAGSLPPQQQENTEFRPPASDAEWARYHEIRKKEIFDVLHPELAFDPWFASDGKTPDDRKEGNYPFILIVDGEVIGTMRIDLLNDTEASYRLIAIDHRFQKKGYGDQMMQQADAFVRSKNRSMVLLHAEKPAISFYQKHGFTETKDWMEKGMGAMDMKKILGSSSISGGDTYFLAWTTTPWTLPGNLFLAVHPETLYVTVQCEGKTLIVAQQRVESVFKGKEHAVVGEPMTGASIVGKHYEPLFPYFTATYGATAFRVVAGDFVTTDDGTGIVHIAPGFGEDDFMVGKKERVPLLQHVTMEGKFVDAVTDFAGLEVKPKDAPSKTDAVIVKFLQEKGLLFDQKSYTHSYPHCWRCDSPLLNYATSSWFVAVEEMKDTMLAANKKTEWVPAHLRDGRFGKWLEGARDWAISRNRYWGTPLPIWRNLKTKEMDTVEGRDDVFSKVGHRLTKLTVLRHGESDGNLTPVYQGKDPGTNLTARGKTQAAAAGKALKGDEHPVAVIYCSPLARTRQTAEAIAKATGAAVIVDERLREVHFGEYEGKTVDFSDLTFVKARRAHKLQTGQVESIYHFPGMETWKDVEKRIGSFLADVLPKHRNEHIAIVTHADPFLNIRHSFTKEDPAKLCHQPYPGFAEPKSYYWDHQTESEFDLHKETVDEIAWEGKESKGAVHATFVRHGETDWNREKRCQGQEADRPLTENGKEQIAAAAKALKRKKFDGIVCSDLLRTKETAAIMAKELKLKILEETPLLRERGVGDWAGKLNEEITKDFPLVVPNGELGLHHQTGKNGESLTAFLARMEATRAHLLERYPGKNLLVVTHGGTIKGMRMVANHLPYSEALEYAPANGETADFVFHPLLHRIPEVLDCWFESGSMPYAQSHYPFEYGGHRSPPGFPADFIAEGIDQTRGWFYTLTVLSSALFGTSAFKHCIVNGTVLAEDGKKMSKKLKNYPDPLELAEKHGADAVRFALMSSPAVRGEDLRFGEKLVAEQLRGVLLPLWNTYAFFVTYANAAQWDGGGSRRTSGHPLDRWIRAEVQDLVNRMTDELEGYDLSATCAELSGVIDALTNWYVRLSRRRFAGKAGLSDPAEAMEEMHEQDRLDALSTLHDVLLTLSQLLAPFCPFIAEAMYLNLVREEHGSIHLTDWPEQRALTKAEKSMLTQTRLLRTVVTLGLQIRSSKKVKVRQPLARATVAVSKHLLSESIADAELALLREELNVKVVEFVADASAIAESFAQVDARKAGPRLGGKVQEIIKAGKAGNFTVEKNGTITILGENLTREEAVIVYRGKEGQDVAADVGVVVSLDTAVTPELISEGRARDLIRQIQQLRKESGLQFTDRIVLSIGGVDDLLKDHGETIAKATNATLGPATGTPVTIDLDGTPLTICFSKLG